MGNEQRSKKIGAIAVGGVLVVSLLVAPLFISKIGAGYSGVVYNVRGGVEDGILNQGWHIVSPMKKIRQFSTASEQGYLTEEDTRKSNGDESFSIPTKDGKAVSVDLEFSYSFDVEKLAETYTRFKGRDGDMIEDTFMKPKLKVWTGEISSNYSVIDVYGEKRAALNKDILDYIKPKFNAYGIIIDSVNISRIGLDEQTEQAIQQRVNIQQELEKERVEKDKATVEAEKKVIQAKGDSDSRIARAKGEAEANRLKSESLTPEILRQLELEARMKHGWITIQGGDPIVDARENE